MLPPSLMVFFCLSRTQKIKKMLESRPEDALGLLVKLEKLVKLLNLAKLLNNVKLVNLDNLVILAKLDKP